MHFIRLPAAGNFNFHYDSIRKIVYLVDGVNGAIAFPSWAVDENHLRRELHTKVIYRNASASSQQNVKTSHNLSHLKLLQVVNEL